MRSVPALDHAARQRLIREPFHCRIIPGKSWGGVNLGNAGEVPTHGHRTWTTVAEDEENIRVLLDGNTRDAVQGHYALRKRTAVLG